MAAIGRIPLTIALALLTSVPGCGRRQPPPQAGPQRYAPSPPVTAEAGEPSAETAPAQEPTARPSTRTETLSIEGMEETFTLHLFDDPAFPFTTYLPEDMTAETVDTLEGKAVRFFAEFGGERNEQAYLLVYLFPENTTLEEAEELTTLGLLHSRENPGLDVRTLLGDLPEEFDDVSELEQDALPAGWWSRGYTFAYTDISGERRAGIIRVGSGEGHVFYVLEHYPEEYAEGMAPRTQRMLEDWRWRATGANLIEPSPALSEED